MVCKYLRVKMEEKVGEGRTAILGVSANRPERVAEYVEQGMKAECYFCQRLATRAVHRGSADLTAETVDRVCRRDWSNCEHYRY